MNLIFWLLVTGIFSGYVGYIAFCAVYQDRKKLRSEKNEKKRIESIDE